MGGAGTSVGSSVETAVGGSLGVDVGYVREVKGACVCLSVGTISLRLCNRPNSSLLSSAKDVLCAVLDVLLRTRDAVRVNRPGGGR
jgi:hypothetical protein